MPFYNAGAVDFLKKRNAIAMNYCSSLTDANRGYFKYIHDVKLPLFAFWVHQK